MTRRRQFGSIRKLPSGRWQPRYRAHDGRLVPAPVTFPTKADAGLWLAAAEAEQARGSWVEPGAGKVTLAEYAWAWWHAKVDLAPRTREIYALQLRLHILPALGEVELRKLTPELIRAWYAELTRERGASVAAKAYTRLRQILTQAVNDDRIAKNPCRTSRASAERHPEQRFASLPQLLNLADAVPDRYRALVLCAGLAGLRQGELFALRRRDVDPLHAAVAVHRKRLRLASGEVIEDDPKSRAGKRVVALPQPVVDELERHLERYVDADPDAYVFTSETGVPLERSNFRMRVWTPATAAVGLAGLRFHDLRHTAGTLAAQTGATTKEIMARLGHASVRAAMIYQHATDERDRVIADRLTAMTEDAERTRGVRLRRDA